MCCCSAEFDYSSFDSLDPQSEAANRNKLHHDDSAHRDGSSSLTDSKPVVDAQLAAEVKALGLGGDEFELKRETEEKEEDKRDTAIDTKSTNMQMPEQRLHQHQLGLRHRGEPQQSHHTDKSAAAEKER